MTLVAHDLSAVAGIAGYCAGGRVSHSNFSLSGQ